MNNYILENNGKYVKRWLYDTRYKSHYEWTENIRSAMRMTEEEAHRVKNKTYGKVMYIGK